MAALPPALRARCGCLGLELAVRDYHLRLDLPAPAASGAARERCSAVSGVRCDKLAQAGEEEEGNLCANGQATASV